MSGPGVTTGSNRTRAITRASNLVDNLFFIFVQTQSKTVLKWFNSTFYKCIYRSETLNESEICETQGKEKAKCVATS